MLDRARGRVLDLGFAAGWNLVKSAPPGVAERAFRAVADATTVRNGAGARQLRKNLRRVVGPGLPERQLDQLVGDALRSYARYWLETFRLPAMDLDEVAARADAATVGTEHFDAAVARGRGVIIALPHIGNWDVAGIWLVTRCGRFTTVAERLRPESLYDRFVGYRESLGFEIVPLTGGDRAPLDVLRERLRQNRVVCLLADRDLSRSGIQVDLFGEPTRMPGGPALLAATTGAALLPVSMWFTDDGGWGQVVNPPVDMAGERLREQVPAATQAMADAFGRDIAAHPADWHMLQPLWLADLAPRPSAPPHAGAIRPGARTARRGYEMSQGLGRQSVLERGAE
jgi:lauroyl/myristoyl acyltransferase